MNKQTNSKKEGKKRKQIAVACSCRAEQGVQSNSLGRVNVMRHAQLWSVSTPWNWYYIGPPASLQSAKNGDTSAGSAPQLRLIIIIIMGIAITLKFTCDLQSLSETSWFDKCDFRRILQFTCAKFISIYYSTFISLFPMWNALDW